MTVELIRHTPDPVALVGEAAAIEALRLDVLKGEHHGK